MKPISIDLNTAPDKSMGGGLVMTPGRQVNGSPLQNNIAGTSGAVSNRETPAFNQDEAILAQNLITTINDESSDIKMRKDDNNLDLMPEAKLLHF